MKIRLNYLHPVEWGFTVVVALIIIAATATIVNDRITHFECLFDHFEHPVVMTKAETKRTRQLALVEYDGRMIALARANLKSCKPLEKSDDA